MSPDTTPHPSRRPGTPAWKGVLVMLSTLLLSFSIYLFWHHNQAETRVQAVREQLRELFTLEAALVGETLRIRYGHSNNYDLINAYSSSEESRLRIVQKHLLAAPEQAVGAAAAELMQGLRAKESHIDLFKRARTIMRSSQHALSAALAEVLQSPDISPPLREASHQLQQAFLYQHGIANLQFLDEIPFLVELLREAALHGKDAALRDHLTAAARHADLLAGIAPHLNALTEKLTEPESIIRLRALAQRVENAESQRQTRLAAQQLTLGLGLLSLLIVLGWLGRAYMQDKRMASMVFETPSVGIMITDSHARILRINAAFTRVSGYSEADALGKTPAILHSGKHPAEFYKAMWDSLIQTGGWQGELINRRKNGELYPQWLSILAVRNEAGATTHYAGVFSDLSEIRAAQERIEHMAYHDALTGLPNRTLMRDRVEQAIAEAKRDHNKVALMFIDLDNFKGINDTLGHAVGDILLCEAADRIKSCLRASDTLARYGGDEFVLMPRSANSIDAVQGTAEKLLTCMHAPFNIQGQMLNITCSIGIALFPDDAQDYEGLMQQADTALYRSKEEGRDTYHFYEEVMNSAARERLLLHNNLSQALSEGEISLHYQPRVDLASGRILGAEALMRWNSKELGSVSPVRFIPVAEASGFIVPLGAWALREACRQGRIWHDAGHTGFSMAVNISAVQFARADVVREVQAALQVSGLPPNCLELELTESVLVKDVEKTLALVHALKALGVRIAIDDFGTGYSSLSYLKRFKVDILKIDQSFVHDLATDPDDAAIIQAIQQLAANLGMSTIAEGVETPEQQAFLLQAGCRDAQGYLFSKPVTAEAFTQLLLANGTG